MKRYGLLFLILLPWMMVRAQYSVALTEEANGNKFLTASVNGLPVDFTFDTGCSSLSLNGTIFNELLRRGLIREEDVYGEGEAEIASGASHMVRYFIVKRLQLGDYEMRNVRASVGVNDQPDATPLLGQAVLERFASYTVSNNRLLFKPKPEEEQYALYKASRMKEDTTIAAQRQIIEALRPFANRLSPRYQVIYADALRKCKEYKQSIAVYEQLMKSGTFREDACPLIERIVNTEAYYAGELYEDSLYAECEHVIQSLLQHAGDNPKLAEEKVYAYTLLCYIYLIQGDYARAEESITQYANYVLAPNSCKDLLQRPFPANAGLAKLFYYLYRHYDYTEDEEKVKYYQRLCDHIGGYTAE